MARLSRAENAVRNVGLMKRRATVLYPPSHFELGPEGSASHVLTFRNIHNFINDGFAEEFFNAAARVLKSGGILGVVEHRANEGVEVAEASKNGYVPQSAVVALAEKAGLKFAGASDVNANPADDHNHPNGVWSLPPSLRGGNVDREKFLAIGESDRMTLKFTKP